MDILERQASTSRGAKVIDHPAAELRSSFPDMKGFSARNLKYMRAFGEAYPDLTIVQAGPAQITWYHNCTLLDKVKTGEERVWYALQTVDCSKQFTDLAVELDVTPARVRQSFMQIARKLHGIERWRNRVEGFIVSIMGKAGEWHNSVV